jgi:hypothetical protein
MDRIVANTTILTFILQFYKLVSNVDRFERLLEYYHACEINAVIKCDGQCYKFEVTQELIDILKHSAFERYSSLRALGATDILTSFLEKQKIQDHGQSEAPVLSISNGL